MKKIFFPVLVFIISKSAAAQVSGNVNAMSGNYYSPQVSLQIPSQSSNFYSLLEANVMMNVKADSYVAIFSLAQYGSTTGEAEASLETRIKIFSEGLKKIGIIEEDIFFDPTTFLPTYETTLSEKKLSKTFNEVPTGYEIKKNVHILFKDQQQINEIVSVAAAAEVYDLVKVDYILENKDQILATLRNEALLILMQKKKIMESAGLFVRLNNIGEMNGTAFPSERYSSYTAFKSGVPPRVIQNAKNKIEVTYNYADKSKTVYYDKVSDKQFDKIINPVVLEPVIQVYFSLKASYVLFDPEQEKNDKIYNEKLKELRIKDLEADIFIKKNPPVKVK